MKKIIFSMLFVAGLFTAAMAQDPAQKRTPESRVEMMVNNMQKKLSLTDDQKAKITEIQLDRMKKMQEIRDKNKGDRAAGMEEMQKVQKDIDDKMNQVLNDDQKKGYQEMKDKMKERAKERTGGKE